MSLREGQGDLQYELSYQPNYERFFGLEDDLDAGNISGFDHNASGVVSWELDPLTRVGANGSFFRQRRVRQEFLFFPDSPDPALDVSDGEYLQRGQGSAFLLRQVTPRLSVRASYDYDNFDTEPADQGDTVAHSGSAGFDYAVTRHTRLGVSGTLRFRKTVASVDGTQFRSGTRTVDILISLDQEFTENLELSVAVGPSFLDTRDEQSTLRDPDGPFGPIAPTYLSFSNQQSVFAVVRGTYRYRDGVINLSYTRSEGGGGGTTAASTIVDSLSLGASYRLYEDWTLRSNLNWNRRASISSAAFFGLDTRVSGVSAVVSAEHQITPRFSVSARVFYGTTNRDDYRPTVPGSGISEINDSADTDIVSGRVAIRYTFEPYVF